MFEFTCKLVIFATPTMNGSLYVTIQHNQYKTQCEPKANIKLNLQIGTTPTK